MSKSGLELVLADVRLDELLDAIGAPELPPLLRVLDMRSQEEQPPNKFERRWETIP
jgi:hypothetical protein